MDWQAIKAEIYRRNSSLAELARDCGLSQALFSQVKTRQNRRAEAAIAAFIGSKPELLWPERYRKKPRHITSAYKHLLASQFSDASENKAGTVNKERKTAAA